MMSSPHSMRALGAEADAPMPDADLATEGLSDEGSFERGAAAPAYTSAQEAGAVDVPASLIDRYMPALTGGAIALWSVFFFWAHRGRLATGLTSAEVAAMVGDWALPVAVIVLAWLVAMRSSVREAKRFGTVAASLDSQSRVLEDRLRTVNHELSLARDFLAAETRELDFLGRAAGERIGEHAGHLQSLIRDNGAQVDAIAGVSAAALDNMYRLRQELPVVAASARDMSNQIGNTGRSAAEQIGLLAAEFDRMRDAGQVTGTQIEGLRAQTGDVIAATRADIDGLAHLCEQRLAALGQSADEFRRTMAVQEDEAIAAVKARTTKLGSELAAYHARLAQEEDDQFARLEQRLANTRDQIGTLHQRIGEEVEHANGLGQRRLDAMRDALVTLLAELEQLERQADAGTHQRLGAVRAAVAEYDEALAKRDSRLAAALAERQRLWDDAEQAAIQRLVEQMNALDSDMAVRRKQEIAQMLILAEHSETITGRMDSASQQLQQVIDRAVTAQQSLSSEVDAMTQRLGDTRELIDEADGALNALTATSSCTLDMIRAGADLAEGEFMTAVAQTLAHVEAVDQRSAAIATSLGKAEHHASALHETLLSAGAKTETVADTLASLEQRLGGASEQHATGLIALRHELEDLQSEGSAIAAQLSHTLNEVVEGARRSFSEALSGQHADQDQAIASFTEQLGQQSAATVTAALTTSGREAADELIGRVQQATDAGRDAVVQLRDQLARIHELTSNLESRIARAHEQSEENIDNDFSRRVAVITERLNSTSIDLDKHLSTEVSETAWTSYLKGDRGIFTRKAVRLLDNRDAREIVELYNNDAEFRGHVNRYVHDFEAMLRSLLATRNGNALSVTVLSSDMGKLYVALAQAIERLRQ